MTINDVQVILGSGVFIIILMAVLFRPLLFASIEPEVAEARGVPVQRLSILFLDPACAQRVSRGESGRCVIGLCTFSRAGRGG